MRVSRWPSVRVSFLVSSSVCPGLKLTPRASSTVSSPASAAETENPIASVASDAKTLRLIVDLRSLVRALGRGRDERGGSGAVADQGEGGPEIGMRRGRLRQERQLRLPQRRRGSGIAALRQPLEDAGHEADGLRRG